MATRQTDTLWARFRDAGDADAREALIVEHLPLVKYLAGRMKMKAPAHVEVDDLIGWGIVGLIDAVERFEPDRDLQFTTYATYRIRGAILDQLRAMDWAPRSLRAKARQLEAARQKLLDELGRPPLEAELAEELELTRDQVFDLVSDIHGAYVLSLDQIVTGEDAAPGEATLGHLTRDTRTPSPRESARREEAVERLTQAILDLPPQERHVLMLYYEEGLTLKEIGAVLDLSESRICQINRKAMRKLSAIAEA